jgi:hypothetical protein
MCSPNNELKANKRVTYQIDVGTSYVISILIFLILVVNLVTYEFGPQTKVMLNNGMTFLISAFVVFILVKLILFTNRGMIDAYNSYPKLVVFRRRLAEIMEKRVIPKILTDVMGNDAFWIKEAANAEYNFVKEHVDAEHCCVDSDKCHEEGKKLSVFDVYLPIGMRESHLKSAWRERQQYEKYFHAKGFPRGTCRDYVLQRLENIVDEGMLKTFSELARHSESGITDSHIISNVLVKMMDDTYDGQFTKNHFLQEFQSYSKVRMFLEYCGLLSPTVYLKHITIDGGRETIAFDIVTCRGYMRVTNVLDAFALFFHIQEEESWKSTFFSKELSMKKDYVIHQPVVLV